MLNCKIINEEQLQIDDNGLDGLLDDNLKLIVDLILSYGFKVRVVGGAVRDILTGKTPRDVDLITDASPDEIIYILSTKNIDADSFGIKHGTIKAIFDGIKYEITSLDYQIKKVGDKIIIHRNPDWKSDAQRRDFTMNAMSMDMDGKVYDYFGGYEDLSKQYINPLPGFEEKVQNDPIVILRFFRFLSKFSHPKYNKSTIDIIQRNADLVNEIAADRIEKEKLNILAGTNSTKVIELMKKLGIDIF